MCVFVVHVYHERDEQLQNELRQHLSTSLENQGSITQWDRSMIKGGTKWEEEIMNNLQNADIILLLLSSDFLAEEDSQLSIAMERHQQKQAVVIPIILRPCDWKNNQPLGNLKPLPTTGRPITTWNNQDSAFLEVVQGIRQVVDQLRTSNLVSQEGGMESHEISCQDSNFFWMKLIGKVRPQNLNQQSSFDIRAWLSFGIKSIHIGKKEIQLIPIGGTLRLLQINNGRMPRNLCPYTNPSQQNNCGSINIQVYGDEEHPQFHCTTIPNSQDYYFPRGSHQVELGILNGETNSCYIRATFEVSQKIGKDVIISQPAQFLTNRREEKAGILGILMGKRLQDENLLINIGPCLSKVRLSLQN